MSTNRRLMPPEQSLSPARALGEPVMPAGMVGYNAPESIEVAQKKAYDRVLESEDEGQLIGLIVKRGASPEEARRIAPLVDAFIAAKLNSENAVENLYKPPVPVTPPALYKDQWVKGVNNSEDFLKLHYSSWLGQGGGLYRPVLARLDPELLTALDNAFRGRKAELAKLLPTKSDEVNDRLEALAGHKVPHEKRARAAGLERQLRSALRVP